MINTIRQNQGIPDRDPRSVLSAVERSFFQAVECKVALNGNVRCRRAGSVRFALMDFYDSFIALFSITNSDSDVAKNKELIDRVQKWINAGIPRADDSWLMRHGAAGINLFDQYSKVLFESGLIALKKA